MIFLSKRTNRHQHSSAKEACLSIIGLILAIGLVGGLSALVYGLIKGSSSEATSGAVILGISMFFTALFIPLMMYCLKNDNATLKTNHQHRRKQHDQIKQANPSHDITAISTIQQYGQTDDFHRPTFLPSVPMELTDHLYYGFDKHVPPSSVKTTTFDSLSQSNPPSYSYDLNPNYYNRH